MTNQAEAAESARQSVFDPLDPDFIADPHRVLGDVRTSCPVAYSDRFGGFWALTRRRDVVEAAKRHDVFINSVLHIISGRTGAPAHTRPLMHSDQPEHTWFRAAMMPVLGGPIGPEIEPDLRAEAERLVAVMAGRAEVDLVRDFCGPLMAFAITRIFGMEDVDPAEFDRWNRQYVDGGQDDDREAVLEAHEHLVAIAEALLADRRAHPRDPSRDLATALIRARTPDGDPLDPQKIVGAVRQPFLIVWLATSHSLGNMLQRLLVDRGLQETLRERPELIDASVDEFLRLDMPQLGFGRTPAHDVEFAGVRMRKDEPVALVFPAANRDPEVFEDPDEFRIGRSPNPHLAFGAGVHSCPGKGIGRNLILIALESIINGTAGMEPCGEIVQETWPFRAPRTLPARLVGQPGLAGGVHGDVA
ncbi:cytochrome P450 [Spirillospora sp. NPDC029432]|uniref:cytochrome P450 n=1 Tax=Spirillospora sp. NPDC029432 TaxID=3154599 RepID=UPI0034542A79